jgi:hypothetical protein
LHEGNIRRVMQHIAPVSGQARPNSLFFVSLHVSRVFKLPPSPGNFMVPFFCFTACVSGLQTPTITGEFHGPFICFTACVSGLQTPTTTGEFHGPWCVSSPLARPVAETSAETTNRIDARLFACYRRGREFSSSENRGAGERSCL